MSCLRHDIYDLLTSLKQGIISIQGVTTGEELSSAMAFMVFTQSLFPAIILSLCNLVLVLGLKSQLPLHAPNADAALVIKAGATNFRDVVDAADLNGVITAYFSLALALCEASDPKTMRSAWGRTHRFFPSSKSMVSFDNFHVDNMLRTCRMSDCAPFTS